MTPDQISKLPPELRKAAELCERFKNGLHVKYAASWLDVHAALTWGLQVVEERDAANERADNNADEAAEHYKAKQTAEATIATLTRERDELVEELRREQKIIGLPHISEGETK